MIKIQFNLTSEQNHKIVNAPKACKITDEIIVALDFLRNEKVLRFILLVR